MVEVVSNYMFRPLWWHINSISGDRIIFYLMMSKGPWGGRGAEFLESSVMW